MTHPITGTKGGAAREMATPVILMTRSREGRPADAADPVVDERKVSLNHSYAVVGAYLDAENPGSEWISLRNPLGSRHLFEFSLKDLLIGDPQQPEVHLFRSFVVGRLASK
ncbi:hypothetical protein [Enhygromyxa salina]|uniref:hypothetical protein n=1 Tax=Enhygromyxa salina TaxID=215803 RepID=UPI0015E7B015|nr:hypothetical protein [Enhygromyxa salina]